MVGTLLKSHKMRMSPEKQETLLKLSILSLAAILCKYISVRIHSLNVLVLFSAFHISIHDSVSQPFFPPILLNKHHPKISDMLCQT